MLGYSRRMHRADDDSEAESRAALGEARQHASALVDGLVQPYEAGRAIWAAGLGGTGSCRDGSHCSALWLLWGSLTDWVENKPAEAAEAEVTMRRAAAEWLEVADNEIRWRQYFERWLYDEMGYERESPQTVYVELLEEGVEVWRPVEADVEAGAVFRLPRAAPANERWRLPPGSRVRCEWRELSDGCILAATEIAD